MTAAEGKAVASSSRKRRPSPHLSAKTRRRMKLGEATRSADSIEQSFSATVDRNVEWHVLCTSIVRGVPFDFNDGPAPQGDDGQCYAYDDDDEDSGFGGEEKEEGGDGRAPTAHVLNFLSRPEQKNGTSAKRHDSAAAAAAAAHPPAHHVPDDPWLDNALRLSDSIRQMSNLLVGEEATYANVYAALPGPRRGAGGTTTDDGERNDLEETVASFAVSTGNQIEALRQALLENRIAGPDGTSSSAVPAATDDVSVHRSGIVSCLLSSLRTDVVDRMGRMNALRNRESLAAARDPLACRLVLEEGTDDGGILGGLDGLGGDYSAVTEEEEEEAMERERAEEEEFDAIYGRAGEEALMKELLVPPVFPRADGPTGYRASTGMEGEDDGFVEEEGGRQVREQEEPRSTGDQSRGRRLTSAKLYDHRSPDATKSNKNRIPSYPKSATIIPTNHNDPNELANMYGETAAEHEAFVEDMQRESAYLTASVQNELEDVRKVETKMGQIVTLLSQFGNLVTEQQEDIIAIHDRTEESKKNLKKGEDSLVDATERKKQSKHRMATFIVAMALLLLFFNWITP